MYRLWSLCPDLPIYCYNTGVKMVKEFNILIAGVGGQGVILMSELLGNAAVKDNLDVTPEILFLYVL